ncbi:uncharacterized protein C15orf39 homolog [Stegostoma tigrinum]|uniref:uncharacterized protein C15orf39 homolog n=1 Tax=Stegostoma tigrinum TaxID=3053191 RepID=UPI00287076BB|nr:uncharacterized protein C15orf39 homolog [Stegostoma tigrinum]
MMANKRSLDGMDSIICSKMPRLEDNQNGLSAGLYKPSPLSSYAAENPLKYTGSYLAYHLQSRDGTDPSGVWNQPHPCVHHMGGPNNRSPPGHVSSLSNRLYQTEPETGPRPFQQSVNANDKLDLVKDLMNVRSKWVSFVERQKNVRKSQNLPPVLCSTAVGKHSLFSSALSTVSNCANVAFPQPVYRNSVCCSGAGFSLEDSTDHFYRRGPETEWRMPSPVPSSCLIVNNSQLVHNQQYANPLVKNNSLHSGSGSIQVSSVGRITKETGKPPGVRSPLCRGYGTFNSDVLQDPRYSMISYENSNGSVPSHSSTSIHNIQDLQKVPLHPFVTTEGQQMQLPLYRDKPSPPKYPVPIQPKVLHSRNTISNQQSVGTYSLLHPRSYKAQMVNYPVPGAGGRMPIPSSAFASQLGSEYPYAQPSESFGYPVRRRPPPPQQQKSVSVTGPLVHPVSQPMTQPTEFEQQSLPGNKVSSSCQDPTNAKHSSPDLLHFRPRIIAQTNEECYNSLNTLYNMECTGQQQLISKHSAFHPVLSGKHLKGSFERPAGSPGAQRPKDIYLQEHSPGFHISAKGDHGGSIFNKEPEILNNKSEVRLDSPRKSYTVSPTRKTSVINFSPASSPAAVESRRATPPASPPASPPMPVINNVFSLAPYKAYLEATGLFFSKCPNCQPDCDKSCSCSLENKTESSKSDGIIDLDSNTSGPKRLPKASSQLQLKNDELKTDDASACLESMNEKGAPEDELSKAVSKKNSLDTQYQEINLSAKFNRPSNGQPQQSGNGDARCVVHSGDVKLGMNTMDDMALDLSTKSKSPLLNVTEHALVSGESREKLKCMIEISNEKEENTIESLSSKKKQEDTEPSGEHRVKALNETSSTSDHLILEMNKYKILRPAPPKIGENNPTLPSEGITKAKKISLIGSVDPSALILRPLKPLKRILPDVIKSIMSSTPESSKTPCKTKVDSSSNGKLTQNENDTYNYFAHLHQSLCDMITQSVAETSEEVLRACLHDIEEQETPKLRSSVKSKNGTRTFEALKMSKSKEIWRNYGQVQQTLKKLLSYLESYIYSRTCPFPHVIRAGTIFIPIYLVKEKLFSSLKGVTIDQVFQEHKIELRPTTLSEEKKLQTELQLQRCSSRLIKLLSLKQLPEIYQDLLDVLWHSCVKIRLGEQSNENVKEATVAQNLADHSANENQRAQPCSTEIKTKTVANTACSKGKPDNGIATARHNAKLKKRKRKIRTPISSINCNYKFTDSSNSSQSFQKIRPKSVLHLEKKSCTPVNQDASIERSSKVCRPGSRKLRKREGVYNEKGFVKGNFERKGSTLVVQLNRVSVNEDDTGTNVSCSKRIKKSQMPIKKKNNGALRPTRSTSKVLHLRGSIVRLKFQKPRQTASCRNIVLKSIVAARKPLLTRTSQQLDKKITKSRSCGKHQGKEYPNLVGKRIRHLYEEKDKSESWYKGVVVRVHEKHQNPLETVYEVKYDTEPDWQYYLELLQDYEKGWLRVDD